MSGKKFVDRIGQRYGRLTVIRQAGWKPVKWHCLCDCGNEIDVISYNLGNGNTQSCGCLQKDKTSCIRKTHGMATSHLYSVWSGMKSRCYNSKNKRYTQYGGRGIIICDEWLDSFENFMDWAMSNGYADGLTIDRIDVNGCYCPDNCRWATWKEQGRNKQDTSYITLFGETMSVAEASEKYGICYSTLWGRIFVYGYTPEEAVTKKVRTHKP